VAAEQVLWRSLAAIEAGRAPQLPNELSAGSYFSSRRPEDGRIDWSRTAAEVYNLIRAVAPPYPGAFTDLQGQRLIVAAARRLAPDAVALPAGSAPGLHAIGGRIIGLCGDGGLIDVRRLTAGAQDIDAAQLISLQTPITQPVSSP
jgi:methionyl-tRNA formyltransferase